MERPRRKPFPESPPKRGKSAAVNRAFSALVAILDVDQQQAADALHLTRGTVSDYVRGKSELCLDNYQSKLEGFGLGPEIGEHLLALVAKVDDAIQSPKATSSASAGLIT